MTTTKEAATSRGSCSHPPVEDRRKEVRYLCNDAAEVRLLHGGGQSFQSTILNISKSGLRIACPEQLANGSHVEIILPKQAIVFGEIRHCRRVGHEFQSGVLIEQAFYSMDLTSGHTDDEQISKYLAGEGLIVREVLALAQHFRVCEECRTRLEALALSETVGRGRIPKR